MWIIIRGSTGSGIAVSSICSVVCILAGESFGCYGSVSAPYSGIENVPQDLCMQQYRKLFEFPGAFRHHKRQKAAAVICKCRIVQVCLPEWIIAAGFDVFFDIIVGIHQIDEFSEEESDLTKRGFPFIVAVCKNLSHDIAKKSGHKIQILFIFCLIF